MSYSEGSPDLGRRDFCACAAALMAMTACGGGGGGSSAPSAPTPTPAPTPNPNLISTTDTKAGLLALSSPTVHAFGAGTNDCPNSVAASQGIFLIRDDLGIYAMSRACLHLGGKLAEGGSGFSCPCHGSQYGLDGTVTLGPAPVGSTLVHYRVQESAPGGVLEVDTGQAVAKDVRLN